MAMATCLACSFAGVARGVVIAPVITVNTPTITKDVLFSKSTNNPSFTSESSIDGDGFNRQFDTATGFYQGTTMYSAGSLTANNTYTFQADQRQRALQSENAFHFDATTAISATLNVNVGIEHEPTRFIIATYHNTTTINILRTIRFTVDQPMQLSMQFSGQTSSADFKAIFSSLQLRGGAFQPIDNIYFITGSTYKAATDTIFISGEGCKSGLDYAYHGIADGNGINLILDLNPTIEGTSSGIELRWLLKNTLAADAHGAVNFSKNLTVTEMIYENVSFTAVPEASPLVLVAFSLVLMGRRRRSYQP